MGTDCTASETAIDPNRHIAEWANVSSRLRWWSCPAAMSVNMILNVEARTVVFQRTSQPGPASQREQPGEDHADSCYVP